jgi:membrane-anchored mycosin MYCP
MTGIAGAGLRLVAAVGLLVLAVYGAPNAAAVMPPPVDESLLPKAASPAPPQATEQREQCVSAPAHNVQRGTRGQLSDSELQAVWPLTRGAGQTIAVIDTGVSRHRRLPHLIPGGDYVSSGDGTEDCDGHGTVVAGIIGAAPDPHDAIRFSGVAPDATLISIRQSSTKFRAADDPSGSGYGDVDTLAMAVRTAADMGATVINVSSVACLSAQAELDDRALGAALSYAVDAKNVVVVSAAGNVGAAGQCPDQNPAADPAHQGSPDWTNIKAVASPAWYDEYVLTVGSVGRDEKPSPFTLAGPWVDVAAVGEGVVSLDSDGEGLVDRLPAAGGETPIAGTSYAAPVVSGVVALLRSRSPELTARQVMQRIEDTARRPPAGWDPFVGSGLVDVLAAVTGDQGPTPETEVPTSKTVSVPEERPSDRRSADIAVRGAVVCLGVCAAVVAMTAGTALRRRVDAVPHD